MTVRDCRETLREKLQSENPSVAIQEFVIRLRDSGKNQQFVEDLLQSEMDECRALKNEEAWDAMADAMDFVVGWCPPSKKLF
ncbi:MAG: hypothetical protein MI807_07035 [Verrucomicrobiales bacterium]|nr:hypothetical protein [Verrucomicrobiales bacterium]